MSPCSVVLTGSVVLEEGALSETVVQETLLLPLKFNGSLCMKYFQEGICRNYNNNVWVSLSSPLGGLKTTMSFIQISAKYEAALK